MHTIDELKEKQSLPLSLKIRMTQERIRAWVNFYGVDGVYISFSGGKDSTVLLDIARKMYPGIPAVFVDVPTQYPELKTFAESFDNVVTLKPKISFAAVCEKYGFPLISKEVSECIDSSRKYIKNLMKNDRQTDRQIRGAYAFADLFGIDRRSKKGKEQFQKLRRGIIPNIDIENAPVRVKQILGKMPHKEKGIYTGEYSSMYDRSRYQYMLDAPFEVSNMCCKVMKKAPVHKYGKESGRKPMTAQMADESLLRTQSWLKNGCNAFEAKNPISNPMSFWLENDVLQYIVENNLPICSVYGEVVEDTDGQMSLADYGYMEKETPKYKTTGCSRTGCMLCGFGCHLEKEPNRFQMLKETHPEMYKLLDLMKNNGVTMRQAIEWVNENGGMNIKL